MSEQSYRSAGTLLAQLASGETTSVALVNHYFHVWRSLTSR